jgi:hypothetical protein
MIEVSPIRELLPAIRQFADVPFSTDDLRELVDSLGWKASEDYSEYTDLPDGLAVEFRLGERGYRFLLVADNEFTAAISICALTDSPEQLDYEVSVESEYHASFNDLERLLVASWGDRVHRGQYSGPYTGIIHDYALWRGEVSWIALVEHHEGDANFGHNATVDIRVLPLAEGTPSIPLTTNVIF